MGSQRALNSDSKSFILSETDCRNSVDTSDTNLSRKAGTDFFNWMLDSITMLGDTSGRVRVPLNFLDLDSSNNLTEKSAANTVSR